MYDSAKYHVYIGNQQFGPISFVALIDEIQNENLGHDAFVWREGMDDWKPIANLTEVKPHAGFLKKVSVLSRLEHWRNTRLHSLETLDFLEGGSLVQNDRVQPISPTDPKIALVATPPAAISTPQKVPNWTIFIGASLLIISSLVGAHFWMSAPEAWWDAVDAPEDQIAQMQKVIRKKGGPHLIFAAAPLRGDFRAPALVVVGNLAGPERVRISLQGIPESLIGAFQAETHWETELREGRAETPPLRLSSGALLPRGRYFVRVTCLTCRGKVNREILIPQPIQVGGTENYQSELDSFHFLVREQAESELVEMSEMISVFEEQGPRRRSRKDVEMMEQLGQVLDGANADQYFYGSAYGVLKKAYENYRKSRWGAMQDEVARAKTMVQRFRQQFNRSRGYPNRNFERSSL